MNYSNKLKDPRWQKKRLEILSRDEFTCQICESKDKTLNVHHIAYFDEPWNTPDNLLITMCEDCHEVETHELKVASTFLIKKLKESGFMSDSMKYLSDVFEDSNRGWTFCEIGFHILKMTIDTDNLWDQLTRLYWHELANRNNKNKNENKRV